MTEKQKKAAMIGGAIAVAILLWFLFGRGASGNTTIVNRAPFTPGNVILPNLNLSPRDFVIPTLPGYKAVDGPMMAACCGSCSKRSTSYYTPAPAVVPPPPPAEKVQFIFPVIRSSGGGSISSVSTPSEKPWYYYSDFYRG